MSSGEEKSLDDLKGRVVILDFWATKCGPCIGIMPNMRVLTKRYVGYPVEIIGVTSVMGLPRGREEWKDNPDERKFGI